MTIAKVVKSNSYIDYIARILDTLDVADPPDAEDYGFGRFVSIPLDSGTTVIGIIYDSILVNPEYSSLGPRLSPKPDLDTFTPDFINEQGILIGIILVGELRADATVIQGLPSSVVPPGQEVNLASEAEISRFHDAGETGPSMRYYSQVLAHAGSYALPLLEAIIERISTGSSPEARKRLEILRESLSWQRTVDGLRL